MNNREELKRGNWGNVERVETGETGERRDWLLTKVETWNQKGETSRGNGREGNGSNSIGIQFVDAVLNQKCHQGMVEFHRTRRVPRFSSLFCGVSVVQRGEEVGVHLLGTRGDGLRAGRSRDERKSNAKEFAAAQVPPNRAKRTIPRRSPFPRFHPLGERMRGDRWEIVGRLGWEGGIGDERDDLH